MTDRGERGKVRRRCVVLAVTSDWAFAAGTLLMGLRRHNPALEADILLFHDNGLGEGDSALFASLGCRCTLFEETCDYLRPEAIGLYSPLALAKIACFDLLEQYDSVLWLDADIVVQDSIEDIWGMGPLAIAPEDPEFSDERRTNTASVNVCRPVPGLAPDMPCLNSGVIVLQDDIPHPRDLRNRCMDFLHANGPHLRYPDQAALNALCQWLDREAPGTVAQLPARFNCHPRNPQAVYAPLVHAFGAYKLWNDGLTAACFPEWQRDYRRWLNNGGSPYRGAMENEAYAGKGAFALLREFFSTFEKSEQALATLAQRLKVESETRRRLEAVVGRINPNGSSEQ